MGQFRNLLDGLKFGGLLLAGMILGIFFGTPAVTSQPLEGVTGMVRGAIVGTVLAGIVWFALLRKKPAKF